MATLAAAVLALVPAAPAHARQSAGGGAAALAARNELLRRELELAEGEAFYLLLDTEPPSLRLMYKGAPLRETPIVSAELGEPRARNAGGDGGAVDLFTVWSGGTLHPPRVDVREQVIPPPVDGEEASDGATVSGGAEQGEFLDTEDADEEGEEEMVVEEEVEIPRTPEELYPVPPSYQIRFQEGLTIEIARAEEEVAGETLGKTSGEAKRVAAAAAALQPSPTPPEPGFWEWLRRVARRLSLSRPEGERARLRLELSSRDADRLFRSLPPDVKLLIRPAAAPQR